MSGFDAALTAEAADLLYREAWHLDNREWEAWLALYIEDAVFWAPAIAGEEGFSEDPDNDVSLIYLDRAGLEARIFRIEGRDSFANAPLPHTAHVVGNVRAAETGDADIEVSATWLVNSFRRTDPPILRAGRYAYTLRRTDAGLAIARKTVYVLDDRIVGPIDIFNI